MRTPRRAVRFAVVLIIFSFTLVGFPIRDVFAQCAPPPLEVAHSTILQKSGQALSKLLLPQTAHAFCWFGKKPPPPEPDFTKKIINGVINNQETYVWEDQSAVTMKVGQILRLKNESRFSADAIIFSGDGQLLGGAAWTIRSQTQVDLKCIHTGGTELMALRSDVFTQSFDLNCEP